MKKVIGVGIILSIAASGCHSIQRTIDKATGGPMRLNDVEAAARYLDIMCPHNQQGDILNEVDDKLFKLYKQGKIGLKAYLRKSDETELALAKAVEKSGKEQTDTQYEWPISVRQLTVEMAAAELELVSAIREYQREGGYTKTVVEENKWPAQSPYEEESKKVADKASAIRSALRLPARSEGCKAGKRSLTLEQIERLQST